MNFYKHHIGDYAQATAHLSILEDGCYSRMLRKYYADEKPLPAAIAACQRLVGARTKEEKEAVETVLNEFFELQEDGWHNKRCDRELEEYWLSDEAGAQRKENEKERQRRHREERKKLFDELRRHGIVPDYNTATKALRERLNNVTKTQMSRPVTLPVTCDTTANQIPDTRYQEPEKEISAAVINTSHDETPTAAPLDAEELEKPKPTRAGLLAAWLRRQQIDTSSTRAEILDWAAKDIPETVIAEAVSIAKERKPNERISSAYLAPIVEQILNPKPTKPKEPPWWATEKTIEAKAREVGCWPARGGESWQQLKQRIEEQIGRKSA